MRHEKIRETRELLGELMDEARISFENDDFIEIDDNLIKSILSLSGAQEAIAAADKKSTEDYEKKLADLEAEAVKLSASPAQKAQKRLATIRKEIEDLKAKGPPSNIRKTTVDPAVKNYVVACGYPANSTPAAQIYSRDPSGFTVGTSAVTLPPQSPFTVDGLKNQPLGPTCMKIADMKLSERGTVGGGEVLLSLLTSGSYIASSEGEADVLIAGKQYSVKDMRGGPTKLHPVASALGEIEKVLKEIYDEYLVDSASPGSTEGVRKKNLKKRFTSLSGVSSFNAGTRIGADKGKNESKSKSKSYDFKQKLIEVMSGLSEAKSLKTPIADKLPGIVQEKLDAIANNHVSVDIVVLRGNAFELYEKDKNALEFVTLTQGNRIKIIPKTGTRPFERATREAVEEINKKNREQNSQQNPETTPDAANESRTRGSSRKRKREFSGAGAIAGVVTPLGTGPDGRPTGRSKKSVLRKNAKTQGKSFGGAKPVNEVSNSLSMVKTSFYMGGEDGGYDVDADGDIRGYEKGMDTASVYRGGGGDLKRHAKISGRAFANAEPITSKHKGLRQESFEETRDLLWELFEFESNT